MSPIGDIVVVSTNFTILALLRLRREKGKKGETKRKHQGCDVAKVIDTVERAVSTAKKVYRVIEPVVNAFTNRPKIK